MGGGSRGGGDGVAAVALSALAGAEVVATRGALWLLAGGERRARIRAIRSLPVDPGSRALAYALRRVLFVDGDAVVRAAAARRLGALADAPAAAAWLLEALGDGSPLVRDAILRGLAGCADASAMPALVRSARLDRVWWVRRSALYALGAIAARAPGEAMIAFEEALRDPFWRVRHAAVKILTVLGARDAEVRERVRGLPSSDAQAFLRASWGPVALEAPARAEAVSALPEALRDPDPAVVTARLAEDASVSPVALVELLCDPHVPLRVLAAERVAASGDATAYRAALDWLEEPRVPYVADTVEQLLNRLGDPAAELAAYALDASNRPGAARWAIAWVVATGDEALRDAALARAEADAEQRLAAHADADAAQRLAALTDADTALRLAALPLADSEVLARWAASATGELLDAIAAALHARGAEDELLALSSERPRVRALQLDVRGRRGERDAVAHAATHDSHHGPRAIAARWWTQLDRDAASAAASDPDPAVREAALSPITASVLLDDADPFVARAAIEALVVGARKLDASQLAAGRKALGVADPWIRAQACRLPLTADALPVILERLRDADEGVRSAALDALERGLSDGSSLDAAVASLVARGTLSPRSHSLAVAWQARSLDDAALASLADLPASPVDFAEIAAPEPAAASVDIADLAPAASEVERRAIPRAGFAIAPLVLSGAFDLSPAAMTMATEAGVDTWFWEPSYDRLTAHLRDTPAVHVVAGTYHADAASIEADVDRTLRRLGRDTIDVFLLFWSRSPARVDPAAYAILERLRRAGKIRAAGFSTHDRQLARAAIEASPWDLVMIRHSAAHPGIEAELLPTARATRTAILTFSALCYGRMVSGPGAPSPADCYRYSLSQPGVVGCISAPRRRREVIENLGALRSPYLDDAQLAALRTHGVGVRAENQRFNTLLRQPTRDAAAAARELLLAELAAEAAPAEDAATPPTLPTPRRARGARASRRAR